jgi:hypothetical protein
VHQGANAQLGSHYSEVIQSHALIPQSVCRMEDTPRSCCIVPAVAMFTRQLVLRLGPAVEVSRYQCGDMTSAMLLVRADRLISTSVALRSHSEQARRRLAVARGRPSRTPYRPSVPQPLDAELECLTPAQLIAVLDCIQEEALGAKTPSDRRYAGIGLAVVRAELLSREFSDS